MSFKKNLLKVTFIIVNDNLYNYFAYMSTHKIYTNKPVSISNITILLILIYLVLFEFIWITQSVIPKPSLIIESFLSLWSEYKLLTAFFETTAIIFPAILIAIVLLEIIVNLFSRTIESFSGIFNITAPFKYFSILFVALLLNYTFPESFLAEFLFAILFVLSKLLKMVLDEYSSIAEEYILTAKSLGLSKNKIFTQVIWKSLKPKIYFKLTSLHVQLWAVVLIYEFVGSSIGMGSIYRLAFNYNDILAILSLGIFISLVIFVINSILNIVVSKLIFWK